MCWLVWARRWCPRARVIYDAGDELISDGTANYTDIASGTLGTVTDGAGRRPQVKQLADDLVAFAELYPELYRDQHRDEPPYELDDPVAMACCPTPGVSSRACEQVL